MSPPRRKAALETSPMPWPPLPAKDFFWTEHMPLHPYKAPYLEVKAMGWELHGGKSPPSDLDKMYSLHFNTQKIISVQILKHKNKL
jgi:hypothetical protein